MMAVTVNRILGSQYLWRTPDDNLIISIIKDLASNI